MVRFTETDSKGGCQGLRGGRKVELMFDMYRVSVWDDENVVKMEGDGGCTAM